MINKQLVLILSLIVELEKRTTKRRFIKIMQRLTATPYKQYHNSRTKSRIIDTILD